jgi:membrane peptidoglycan carboxypeptidase
VLSLKLERVLTKSQILELYLNQSPYGGNIYGVEQASETFFGKHASDVDVAEAAYLAAVLPAPSRLSPYGNHKDQLDARKNLVLEKMHEHGYLTDAQLADAKGEKVAFLAQRKSSIIAPHFVFYVQQYLGSLNTARMRSSMADGPSRQRLMPTFRQKAEDVVSEHAATNETNFHATTPA